MLAIIALNHLRIPRQKRALPPSGIGKLTFLMISKPYIKVPLSLAHNRPSMMFAYSVCYAAILLLTVSLLINQLIDLLFILAFLILSGLTLSLLALSRLNPLLFDPLSKSGSWFKSAALWYLGKVASFRAATYGCRALLMNAVGIKEKVV